MKNKKTHWWACTILGISLLSSCMTLMTKFNSESLQIGMSKSAVLDRFGPPYKTEFYKDGDDLFETYYYKETVYVSNTGHVTINNILNFTNNKLESLQQGEEIDPNALNTTTIIKEKEED